MLYEVITRDSVIGIRKELAVEKFLTQLPIRFEIAKKDAVICAVVLDIDETTGKAVGIERCTGFEPVTSCV